MWHHEILNTSLSYVEEMFMGNVHFELICPTDVDLSGVTYRRAPIAFCHRFLTNRRNILCAGRHS